MEDLMLLVFALFAAVGSPVIDASKLALSPPAPILEIDTKKLKGDPFRLTWSPDAQQMYLQTVERDRLGSIRATYHYLVLLGGQAVARADLEPAWSSDYWAWKSTQAAPGLPDWKIEVEQQQKRVTSTSTPMGGDLAKGGVEGSGAMTPVGAGNTGDAMSASMQAQMANYYTLKLKGEVVGEFVNAPAIPGLTFGWGPTNTGLIAFSSRDGRVVIMDDKGRKQEIASSKSALLPAWADNGKRLAYLEKTGKNKFVLKIVDVTQSGQ
jgi:hypothetical protein